MKKIILFLLITCTLHSYRVAEEPILFPALLNCLEYTQEEVCFCCEDFFGKCKGEFVHKFDCLCDELQVPIYEQRNYKLLGEEDEFATRKN